MTDGNPQRKPSDRDAELVSIFAILYIVVVVFQSWVLNGLLRIPSLRTKLDVVAYGTTEIVAIVGLRLIVLLPILFLWLQRSRGELRRCLYWKHETALTVVGAIAITWTASILLNAAGVWPFTWRWASDSTRTFSLALAETGKWVGLGTVVILSTLITPVLEEALFRFGLLQMITKKTRSPAAGVVGSSLVFGAGHLGLLPPDQQHIVNASWWFVVSLILARLTLYRTGNLVLSIVIHSSRNVLEVAFLLLSLSR